MWSFRNWSLRRKMYIQFIGAILPLVVVTWYQQRSTSELPAQVNQALQAYNLSLDVGDHYRLFLNGITDAVDAEKSALGDQAITEMDVVEQQLHALVALDQTHREDNGNLVVAIGRIRTTVLRPDALKALLPLKADINAIKKSLDDLAGAYKKRLEELSVQINEQQSREAIRQRLLAGITMATLIILALIVRRGINNIAMPVAMAVLTARRVAQGNLTGHIDVQDGGDELNELQRALRDMNRSLTDIVGEVRGVSQDISGRTHTIAHSNQELAERMRAQADQLAATSGRIQSLLSAVARNAASSREANELARGAAAVAGKGGHMVEQVTRTMISIQHSSEQVADIIGIIEAIAFQTNLLALNAAVEAARAGEQGQGFAVVASEVRNLAQRSASTAKQIRDIIGNSVDNVKVGAQLVVSTGNTMHELVNAVSRVATVIADIEDASRQQNAEAEQVSRAIADVEDMTAQNSELVNETVFMADSMLTRSAQLTAAVSKFKLYRHWRLQVPWRARVSAATGITSGMVKNLSAVGALVETDGIFKLGDKCWLAMANTASSHSEVLVECEVVRVGEPGDVNRNYGLHFLKMRQQDKQVLHQQLTSLLAQQSIAGITNNDVIESLDAFERLTVVDDDELSNLFEFQSLLDTALGQGVARKAAGMM